MALTLRNLFRPVVSAGLTIGLTAALYWRLQLLQEEMAAKSKAFAATEGVTVWNPLTWANAPRELFEDLELKRLWLVGQLLTGTMIAVGVGGSLATTYFTWKDLIRTPTEEAREYAAKQAIATRAIEVGLPAAAAAANPAIPISQLKPGPDGAIRTGA